MNTIKRIDFLGNANSYPLLVANAMKRLGYEVHMHLLDDYYLNDPKNYYPEYEKGYPDWIHDWRPCNIPLSYDVEKVKVVRDALKKADALVVNCGAVSLAYLDKRPYFCLLTGTDLLTYCDDEFLNHIVYSSLQYPPQNKSQWYDFLNRVSMLDFQRESIREANGYSFFPRALQPLAKKILEQIGADEQRQYSLLITDVDKLNFDTRTKKPEDIDLNILVSARCTWDRSTLPLYTEIDYKGTDVFLQGAAIAISNRVPLRIQMFKKGHHVQQAEELVAKLGIANYVNWNDEVSQAEFQQQILLSDVVVDNLDTSHIGMAAVDAFALGRPVIAKAPDNKVWKIEEPFPVCHAQTPEGVARELAKLQASRDYYDSMAVTARNFAEKYLSATQAAATILSALQTPSPARGINIATKARRELELLYLDEVGDDENLTVKPSRQSFFNKVFSKIVNKAT